MDVRWRTDDVVVEVTDNGAANDRASLSDGHGLRGMRERAVLCGGSLQAEAVPGGGFRVRACLPVGVR